MQLTFRLAMQWRFVLPAKGSIEKYAVAELPRFVFEIGRTFGIVQYDKENSLKVIAKELCKKEVLEMYKGPCMVN